MPPGATLIRPPGQGQSIIDGVATQVTPSHPPLPESGTPAEAAQATEAFLASFTSATGLPSDAVVVSTDERGAHVSGLLTNGSAGDVPVPASGVTSVTAGKAGLLLAAGDAAGAGRDLGSDGSLRPAPGGSIGLLAGGLPAGASGQVSLRSDPTLLGTFTVADDGLARGQVTLPEGIPPGAHTLVVTAGSDAAAVTFSLGVRVSVGEVVDVVRIAGPDRFATAADAATAAYPEGADTVVIAAGHAFPDALAGSALAGSVDGPILLIDDRNERVPGPTLAALNALDPARLVVLGGPAAVPSGVFDELARAGGWETERIAGTDRYRTAAAIAEQVGPSHTVVVVSGEGFADALAVGPLAAATGLPVLLTAGEQLPSAAADAVRASGAETVLLAGGRAAVSEQVADQLDGLVAGEVIRLAGSDRTATAAAIASYLLEVHGEVFGGEQVLLANGRGFADALAGAPLAAQRGAPLLLTADRDTAPVAAAWMAGNPVTGLAALGGPVMLAEELLDTLSGS